eukprot:TRINITY_DN4976_c0_g1_i1.p1 TRINITY_DN4976_c0_g1~~TRINITY_DN4976_c0_g1_i1.p1  ORF type:complete len:261 (+),score=47.25 TRINITY_DN4976_c0_g1_i1:84-866(+)
MSVTSSPDSDCFEVEQIIESKEREYSRMQVRDDKNFARAEEDTTNLLNGINMQQLARVHAAEAYRDALRKVSDQTDETIRQLRQDRYALSIKGQQVIDEHVAEVQGCAAEEEELYKASTAYTHEVRDEICHLYTDMSQNVDFRKEQGEKISQAIEHKVAEVGQALAAEARIREESRSTLLELFCQMAQKMDQELEMFKQERHESTDRLITIMENTLPKLDKARKRQILAYKIQDRIEGTRSPKRGGSMAPSRAESKAPAD